MGASSGKEEGSRVVRKVDSKLVSDDDAPERWEQDELLADVKKGWRHCGFSPCTASVCPSRWECGVLPRGSISRRSPKDEALMSPTL